MKTIRIVIIAGILAILATLTRAAELAPVVPEAAKEFYRAGEFSIDLAGGLRTIDFDDERSNVGVGVNFFFTREIGVGVSTAVEDANGSFLDNFSLRGIYRIPINKNAIYGFAGAQRLLNQGDWAGEGGVGVERRWVQHFGTFLEIGIHKELTGERDASATAKVGVRLSF